MNQISGSKSWAIITAGTKGIGRALVERFADQGFSIITCARNWDDLKGLQKNLQKKYPQAQFEVLSADLSVRAEVTKFVKFCLSFTTHPDVLINNAGIYLPGQLHAEEEGALEKMIETNLYSAYHLTRGLLPGMILRKRGHLFNICSTASITPYVNGGSYCISKYAMHGMTKVLREEMKPHGIRVTSIMPGATFTASWKGTTLPEERFMKADDVAASVWAAYALSDQAVVEELVIRPQLGDLG
jgi:NADP-dependent 3-hydroxy acid dehydrogenase YdfG